MKPTNTSADSERLQFLMEATSDTVWDFDVASGKLWCSPQFYELFGYSNLEITRESCLEAIHPEDRQKVIESGEAIYKARKPSFIQEYRFRRADGSYAFVINKGRIVYREEGSPVRVAGVITDVSELKKAYLEAEQLAKRFEILATVTNDALYEWDIKTDCIWYNDHFFSLLGYAGRPESVSKTIWSDALIEEDKDRILSEMQEAFRDGQAWWSCEYRMRRCDSTTAWISERATILYGDDGKPCKMIGGMVDITSRKQAIDKLRESEERCRRVIDTASEGMIQANADYRMVLANEAMAVLLGSTQQELIGQRVEDLIAPEDSELFLDQRRRRRAGEKGRYDIRILAKDGTHRWVSISANPIMNERNEFDGSLAMCTDISERKRTEAALWYSNHQFERLMESGVVGMVHFDSSGRYFDANHAFLAMIGYEADDLERGHVNFRDITPLKHKGQDERAAEEMAANGSVMPFEKELIRKDGTVVPVMMSLINLNNHTGIAIILDISELKRAQEQVERLALIVQSANDAVISLNVDGTVQTWNPGAERLYGFEAREAVNSSVLKIVPTDRVGEFQGLLAAVVSGEIVSRYESSRLSKSGVQIPVLLTVSPIRDRSGQVVGVSEIARDLTEAKNAELLQEKLRQAHKLEGLGRLAGGIAHDFNNLLMVVTSYAEILQYHFEPDDRFRDHTKHILNAANRAAELTHQLLAFSRKQIISPEVFDLNSVVGETTKMLERLIGEDIHLSFVPADNVGMVKADPGQIVQVLMNLCVNSRDAMPDGGHITIATSNIEVDANYASLHPPVTVGSYVMLSVSDTGKGMSEEVKSKAFDPFFTTKPMGKGTGLGLATVYGIVTQSGGYICLNSEPTEGTRVNIYLPRVSIGDSVVLRDRSNDLQSGTETVLVVEDEPALRDSVCEFLQSCGYHLLRAENGEDALATARQHKGPIHVLLTDVVMPKMSGGELGKRLLEERPELSILYMSGYTGDAIVQHGVLAEGNAFLQKPFTLGALARKIRDTVAGKLG